ncbi:MULTISPECIES: hypothetical protein [Rhodococcus]|uniref:hypothetical protein n=1 Tax=Rhodococcus TaxID=1827 RepID=UPI000AE32473|nr:MULTISPECIES: hypothetical protein [Rhodococcus]WAM19834.1 hypothetical protein OYT95_40025 [Rhodococcus sp. JS3073]
MFRRVSCTAAIALAIIGIGTAVADAEPATTFGDGTQVVGADIAPGTYVGNGQADEYGCYWARLSGSSGEIDDIIANGFTDSPKIIVIVKPSDQYFESEGCGTWTLAPASTPQSGTAPELAATESAAAVINVGDYCSSKGATGILDDGTTVHCVRVQFTDAYVWSSTEGLVATDPHFPVDPGDNCLDANAETADSQGRTLYCNPAQNGRNAGSLVWQLRP